MGYDGEGAFTKHIPGYDRVLKSQGLPPQSVAKEHEPQPEREPERPATKEPDRIVMEPKAKRPYRRRETAPGEVKKRTADTPVPTAGRAIAEESAGQPTAFDPEFLAQSPDEEREVPSALTVEKRFSSFGLEYIQALTRLLEILTAPSRERLVQFIIDARIV